MTHLATANYLGLSTETAVLLTVIFAFVLIQLVFVIATFAHDAVTTNENDVVELNEEASLVALYAHYPMM